MREGYVRYGYFISHVRGTRLIGLHRNPTGAELAPGRSPTERRFRTPAASRRRAAPRGIAVVRRLRVLDRLAVPYLRRHVGVQANSADHRDRVDRRDRERRRDQPLDHDPKMSSARIGPHIGIAAESRRSDRVNREPGVSRARGERRALVISGTCLHARATVTGRVARKSDSTQDGSGITAPRAQVEAELDERIAAGQALLARPIASRNDLEAVRNDFYTWGDYNRRLLKLRFASADVEQEYSNRGPAFGIVGATSLEDDARELRDDLSMDLRRLQSIKQQLGLYPEPSAATDVGAHSPGSEGRTTIFVVHGHDEQRKAELAVYLRQVTPLEVVILHEKPSQSRTVIEKFEGHASRAAYAVVLLTGDDEGGPVGSPERRRRARQNVVFELGFFVGALGRSRVTVLYEAGVELPSDVSGVLYVPLDAKSAWKFELAKELKAAGIEVDLNKVL
jgi:predicted nucleotide-binding protein